MARGIKFLGDGEWRAGKHGVQGRRQWRKVHLAMDPATSDIRAVEFTPIHNTVSYASVQSILVTGLDKAAAEPDPILPTPRHDNIRGPAYYQ